MELRDSQTWKNLETAFAGESQAAMKYGYYAAQAKKDGYVQFQNIFEETKANEVMHAKLWFKYLHDGDIPGTLDNLKDAAAGEHYEWTEMYREFADTAREEGFEEIALRMEGVLAIERHHEDRYNTLIERLESGEVFKREDDTTVWKCNVCGHLHVGAEAPAICPVCAHGREHFEVRCVNY